MQHAHATHPALGLRLSILMFLQFFVWGAWYVSMTGWMGAVGLQDLTGWAYTVGPIAAIISPFFLGIIADRFFATQRVLAAMHVLGGAALLAVPTVVAGTDPGAAHGFLHPYVLVLLAHMLCYMPTLGLTNTLSFHNMTNPEKQFPMVRVFGTIGWIAGNIAVGGGMDFPGLSVTWMQNGDQSPLQWYVAGGAGVALGLYSLTLPHTPPPAAGRRVSVREVLGLDSLALLRRFPYLVFIVGSFLVCIPLAAYYNQGRNYAAHVGFEHPTATMSFGQMSEIVFMVLMPAFFARLGVKWMLAAGMLAWVARYGLFSAGANEQVKWMVFVGILLHGICYDFFFVTGFLYVDRKAPRELRGQAQGFLILVTQGLGLGVGAQVVGWLGSPKPLSLFGWTVPGTGNVAHWLVERNAGMGAGGAGLDWQRFWLVPAALAAVVLVLFVLLFRDQRRPETEKQPA